MSSHRIQVSFSEADYALINRLSILQSRSMSSIVGDLFQTVAPVLARVAVVLEAAHAAKEETYSGFRDQALQAEASLLPIQKAALDQFDAFADLFESTAQGIARTERSSVASMPATVPKGSGKGSKPPHSNTGVRSPRRAPITPPKKSVRGSKK